MVGGGGLEGVAFGFGVPDLVGEVGEPVPDGFPELASGLGVEAVVLVAFELLEELGLAAVPVVDVFGERGGAAGAVVSGGVVLVAELGGQVVVAVGAEDAGGEEVVHGGCECVFADPYGLGVLGVPGFVGVVAGVGLAGVVGAAAAAGLAVHPPAAGVVGDVGAQQVGACGLRVGVGGGAGAGALADAGDRGGGVEQLPGDEWFVGGYR